MQPIALLPAGLEVGSLQVQTLLGRGAIAEVYLALDRSTGLERALKVILPGMSHLAFRLEREGRAQQRVRHPNLVRVLDFLLVEGRPALLMEYVPGPSMKSWLDEHFRAGTWPSLDESLRICHDVMEGIEAVHRAGLVHRDLKPSNILLMETPSGRRARVADFGIVKDEDNRLGIPEETSVGTFVGTPGFCAPEQVWGLPDIDARADVFALGCILYLLTCRRPAFSELCELPEVERMLGGEYAHPRSLEPELPENVVLAIEKSLVLERDHRLPDCVALRDVLNRGRSALRDWDMLDDHPSSDLDEPTPVFDDIQGSPENTMHSEAWEEPEGTEQARASGEESTHTVFAERTQVAHELRDDPTVILDPEETLPPPELCLPVRPLGPNDRPPRLPAPTSASRGAREIFIVPGTELMPHREPEPPENPVPTPEPPHQAPARSGLPLARILIAVLVLPGIFLFALLLVVARGPGPAPPSTPPPLERPTTAPITDSAPLVTLPSAPPEPESPQPALTPVPPTPRSPPARARRERQASVASLVQMAPEPPTTPAPETPAEPTLEIPVEPPQTTPPEEPLQAMVASPIEEPPTAATEEPGMGTLLITGDKACLRARSSGETWCGGPIPEGDYEVLLETAQGATVAGQRTVEPGSTTVLRCDAALGICL